MQKIGYFTPTQISGLSLWLDGADINGNGTAFTVGGTISTWVDKSSLGNNMTGTSVTYTYDTTYAANAPTFNGSSSVFNQANSGLYSLNNATTWTVFTVNRRTNTSGYNAVYNAKSPGSGQNNYLIYRYSPSAGGFQFYLGDTTGTYLGSITGTGDGITTLTAQTSGTAEGFINGSSIGSGSTSSSSGQATFTIGLQTGAYMFGFIFEVIVYNRGLSTPQQQSIEGYLAQKWGLVSSLPAGHPGRSQTFYTPGKNPGIAAVPSNILTDVPYTNFFPLSLPACGLWLDAADASTITYSSGSNLSQWRDKSGNGYIMSNNAGTTTVAASSLNSLNTVFTPSGTNTQITNFRGRTKMTFFIVGKCAAGKYLIAFNGGFLYLGNDSLLYMSPPSGNYLDIIDSIGLATPVVSNNTWFIICIGYDNATNSTANPYTINGSPFNGTNRATAARGASGILTDQFIINTLYINSVNGTNSYDSDNTAEMIYYNTTLSVGQRQAVEGYLAWKWGLQSTNLPSQHPYYSAAPLSFNRPSQVASIPIQIRMIPDPWTPLRPLSSGVLPWHWFRGDVGMTTTAWTNFGTSKSNASNVGTITLGNYTQGGSQAGGTNNTCIVSPSGYWRWPGVYQTSYHAIFGVFKLSASLTNGQTWTWKGNSTAGRGYTPQYRITNTSGVFTDDILSQGAFLPLNGVTIDPSTQFYTHSLVWGSSPAVSLLQVGTKIASPNGWTTDLGLGIYDNEYIGFAVAPAQPAGVTMTLCEILLFATNLGYGGPVDLTAMDISNVQAYLARKWGV
jgi:hypothetical protein